jgi:hypothetical protein
MTPFGLQRELVDDRRRDLVAHGHQSAWPFRMEAQSSAGPETQRWRAFSRLVVAYCLALRKSPDKSRSSP